jgi:hypothetical protein
VIELFFDTGLSQHQPTGSLQRSHVCHVFLFGTHDDQSFDTIVTGHDNFLGCGHSTVSSWLKVDSILSFYLGSPPTAVTAITGSMTKAMPQEEANQRSKASIAASMRHWSPFQ